MADQRDFDGSINPTTTEARAGSTPGMVRKVLAWGLGLVIVAFVIIVLVGRS